jgi:hypothetical protein
VHLDTVSGEWILYGVVSWGDSCNKTAHPGVYHYIPTSATWIQKTIVNGTDRARLHGMLILSAVDAQLVDPDHVPHTRGNIPMAGFVNDLCQGAIIGDKAYIVYMSMFTEISFKNFKKLNTIFFTADGHMVVYDARANNVQPMAAVMAVQRQYFGMVAVPSRSLVIACGGHNMPVVQKY